MIVIPNKNFTADSIRLVQLLNSTTKVNMLKACDKLDLYVSPNLKKMRLLGELPRRCWITQ